MATLQPNRLTSISTELAEFDHASDKMRSTRDALHNGPATGSATRESGPFEVSLSAPVKVTPPRAHLRPQKSSKKAPRGPQGAALVQLRVAELEAITSIPYCRPLRAPKTALKNPMEAFSRAEEGAKRGLSEPLV